MNSEQYKMHPIISSNLREQIEKELRSAIIQGRFQPGERLIESTIAAEIGVSRAPVREVLSALEREGLVVNIPRRGSFVVDFTKKDIEEIYSFRLLLEIEALRLAIQRFSEQDIKNLQRLVDNLEKAILRQDDVESILSLDMFFHDYLCSMADHSRLYSTWKSIRIQSQLLMGLTRKSYAEFPNEPVAWHQSILDAIKDKDLEIAETILSEHILDARQRAIKAIEIRQSVE